MMAASSRRKAWLNLNGDENKKQAAVCREVVSEVYRHYLEKVLPIEEDHQFHQFYFSKLAEADLSGKPMVLLIGQSSVGKSTFIKNLLGREYPGSRIGIEATTDKVVAVMQGKADQTLLGNAAVVDESMPFTQLTKFGNGFLDKFEVSCLDNPVLEGISLIDSPGVLAGEKQRNRGYDMEAVVKWFAGSVDMILLLFDVSKLDISDELKGVIKAVKGNDVKIHVILNKADQVTTPQLMRVYGALMWSLGKVIDTPEVSRVYIGSFWDEPIKNDENRQLFESEADDLYEKLAKLPQDAVQRKLNDLMKRVRLAKVHAHITDHLKRKMPNFFGHEDVKKQMIADLPNIFKKIAQDNKLSLGDFPDAEALAKELAAWDFMKFKTIDAKKMEALENMLTVEIPKLLGLANNNPQETAAQDPNLAKGCRWRFQDAGTGWIGFSELTFFESGPLGVYWSRVLGIEETISQLRERLAEKRGISLSFVQEEGVRQFATTGEAIIYLTSLLKAPGAD